MATLVPESNRNAGTYSGILDVPAGTTQVSATMLMATPTAADTRNQAAITVEGEWTPGTWEPIFGPNDWTGGATDRTGATVVPSFTYSTSSRPMPGRMRGTITTNRTFSWGLDVTIS